MRLSVFSPCEFCGAPGYRIAAVADFPSVAELESVVDEQIPFITSATCDAHRFLVERRLERQAAPLRAAYREARR